MKQALVALVVVCSMSGALWADPPTAEQLVPVLQELRTELEWPGLTVDEAVANLKSPQEAFRFVRDDVMLVNYRYSYAGPEAVLRTRVANATDKAYLLAVLIQKMNVKVRMARSDWPADGTPHQGAGPKQPVPALKKLSDLLGKADAEATAPGTMSEKDLKDLRDEVASAEGAIANVLGRTGKDALIKGSPASGDVEPVRTDVDWVWVQARLDGEKWTDLDPVFPDRARPAEVQAPYPFMPVGITIRLVAVRAGQEQAESLVEYRGPVHDVMGYDVLLTFFPASGNLKDADEPEKVPRWRPVLNCGPKRLAGKEFAPAGGPAKPSEEKAEPADGGGGGGGFGGLFGGSKQPAPKPKPEGAAGCDSLRLVLEFTEPGPSKPQTRTFSRVVQYVGAGYDPNELVAVHRVALGMAFVPARVVESRLVDDVLGAHEIRQMAETGKVPDTPPRGYSSRTARVLNSMFFLTMLAAPELKIGWQGPAVFLETYQLRKIEDQRYFVGRLDTLHEAFGPRADSSRRDRTIWGLATAAAEAHLLKTTSVNRQLLAAKEKLRVVGPEGTPLGDRLGGGTIQKSVLDQGGVLVASADAPSSVWAIRPTGDLLAVYLDAPPGAAAKGAGTRARSEAAANAFAALGDGALSALACPAGMLVAPLHAYFQELAKAYYKAASVLDALSTTIETGDDSHMKDAESDYFKNLGRHLTNAMARGFVKGWAENALGAGVGHVLGSGGRYPMTDRIIDGLVATDISLPEELPIFTPVVTRAMDLVTMPTE